MLVRAKGSFYLGAPAPEGKGLAAQEAPLAEPWAVSCMYAKLREPEDEPFNTMR